MGSENEEGATAQRSRVELTAKEKEGNGHYTKRDENVSMGAARRWRGGGEGGRNEDVSEKSDSGDSGRTGRGKPPRKRLWQGRRSSEVGRSVPLEEILSKRNGGIGRGRERIGRREDAEMSARWRLRKLVIAADSEKAAHKIFVVVGAASSRLPFLDSGGSDPIGTPAVFGRPSPARCVTRDSRAVLSSRPSTARAAGAP
ncbi:hypothetical protein FB451DRAFT_1170641 [Mycena latifolia]|nr:hypothetical protein FB451DRAFT_1170641 [Mycena latifolia]